MEGVAVLAYKCVIVIEGVAVLAYKWVILIEGVAVLAYKWVIFNRRSCSPRLQVRNIL